MSDDALDDYDAEFIADAMTLHVVDGGTFALGSLNAGIGRGGSGDWSMESDWPDDGDLALGLSFDTDGADWWLDRIRVDEDLIGVPLEARQPFNPVPLQDWLKGDVTLEFMSPTDVGETDRARALLRLEGLQMTMRPDPGLGGYAGDDVEWVLGQLGDLARGLAFWDRPPEPRVLAAADELVAPVRPGFRTQRMPDGALWGIDDLGRTIAQRVDDEWVEYPVADIFPTLTPLPPPQQGPMRQRVSIHGNESGDVWARMGGGGLARFDGEGWQQFDEGFLETRTGADTEWVQDVEVAPDGTVWVLTRPQGLIQSLLWFKDDEWSGTSVSDILRGADIQRPMLVELAAGVRAGTVQLFSLARPEDAFTVEFDGTSAVRHDRPPFILQAVSDDGSRWGVGSRRKDGLLMIPTIEPTIVEDAGG